MGHRRVPGGANTFSVNNLGRVWHADPFEKKDGAKILIFHDFRFSRQNHPKTAPNGAQCPKIGEND